MICVIQRLLYECQKVRHLAAIGPGLVADLGPGHRDLDLIYDWNSGIINFMPLIIGQNFSCGLAGFRHFHNYPKLAVQY
jgi:hypothetical protein